MSELAKAKLGFIGMALLCGAILAFALSGCEVFEQPYKQPPQLTSVYVHVVWADKETIEQRCGNKHAYACATVGTVSQPYSTIYAIKPRSFTHAPLVEALGHELLHALGATHE